MKRSMFIILIALKMVSSASRLKRAAYDLPAGALEVLIDPVRRTFVCTEDGYYADQNNNCQIFHICHTAMFPGGSTRMLQYSFFCGNLTIFNQYTLTCTYPENSFPCSRAHEYYGINKGIRDSTKPFLSSNRTGGSDALANKGSGSPPQPNPNKLSKPPQPKKPDKKKTPFITDKFNEDKWHDDNKKRERPGTLSDPPPLPNLTQKEAQRGNIVKTTIIEIRNYKNETLQQTNKTEYYPNGAYN